MEVFMLRKIIVASTLGLFLATSVVTPAAAATIKTGTACKKAGQTVKVGKKTYVCGKNPIVTPTKNTYMLTTCSKANALYRDGCKLSQPLCNKSDVKETAEDTIDAVENAVGKAGFMSLDELTQEQVLEAAQKILDNSKGT